MRTLAIARRILLQFIHDKRTLALLFVAPLVVLWLLSVLLTTDAYVPTIATVSLPSAYETELKKQDAHLREVSAGEAKRLIADDKVDGILSVDDDGVLTIEVEGGSQTKNGAVIKVASAAMSDMQKKVSKELKSNIAKMKDTFAAMQGSVTAMRSTLIKLRQSGVAAHMGIDLDGLGVSAGALDSNPAKAFVDPSAATPISDVKTTYLHGNKDWQLFDFYGPVFIGIFLFVFTFITSGMSLVNERTAGTMDRFLLTPVRPTQILGGYVLGFGTLALVQSAVILLVALTLIGFPNEGSVWLVIAMAVSMALASVTLGLLVSGLASNAFQVIQLIILFVVPQILLCGLFDLSGAPGWLQVLSRCLPVTYGVDALTSVMLRGASFADVAVDFAVVWGFVVVFFILAAIGFRKKHARRAASA